MDQPACLLHRGLGRLEAFDFAAGRLPGLRRRLARHRLPFSFHAPLVRPPGFRYPAVAVFFLSTDRRRCEESFRVLEETLVAARAWGAEYVVTHFNWRDDTARPATAARLAEAAAARIAAAAARHGVPVLLEVGGYRGGFHRAADFAALVAPHAPRVELCIDLGHSALIAEERHRSLLDDLERLAPAAGAMHLWNTRGPAHYRLHHHVPLHPSQRPAEGWIDVERALALVLTRRPDCRLIFEYPCPPRVPRRIAEGFAWVAAIAARCAAAGAALTCTSPGTRPRAARKSGSPRG